MSPDRVALGSWQTRNGNGVQAWLRFDAEGVGHLDLEWDDPPPFTREQDRVDYRVVILPQIMRRVHEYRERPGGRALVIGL